MTNFQPRTGFSVLFTIFLVLGTVLISSPLAAAQGTQSHTTADGRHEIVWEGDWELNDRQSEPSVAELLFFSNALSLLNVGFFPSGLNLEEMRDVVLSSMEDGADSSLQVVDSGAYDNVAYELGTMDVSGVMFGVWIVVIDRGPSADTTVVLYGAPIPEFASGMIRAQNEITIDGEEIFKGIDPDALQDLLGEPAQSTSSTGRTGSTSQPTSTSTSNSGSSSRAATDSYTDPTWGYTVEYSAPWTDVSSEAPSADLSLATRSPFAMVTFSGLDTGGVSASAAFGVLSQSFQEGLPAGATMIGQVSGSDRMLFVAQIPEGLFAQEVIFTSGTAILVTVLAEDGVTAAEDLQNLVTVNGYPVFSQWNLI